MKFVAIFFVSKGAENDLASNRPDLVLLDYEMPVVDGSQVLEMIRSDVKFFDIPIIFLTGKSDADIVTKVINTLKTGRLSFKDYAALKLMISR